MTDFPNKADAMSDRYQRAATIMQGVHSKRLVRNTTIFPVWIENSDFFWYERDVKKTVDTSDADPNVSLHKKEYRLVNAGTGDNCIAFDHIALATALAEAAGKDVDADNLPITKVSMSFNKKESGQAGVVDELRFKALDQSWRYHSADAVCTAIKEMAADNERLSPDGTKVVFRRDNNLWLRALDSGEERALTQDGEPDFIYAAPGAAWGFEHEFDQRPQALWSPDSKQIFTVQRDTRQVKTLPIVHHVPRGDEVRPTIEHVKVAYPGDEHVETQRMITIDCETGNIQAADYEQIPTTRNSFGFFSSNLGWWGSDSQTAYFVDLDSSYQRVRVVEFNSRTGATRILFEETSATHINLMLNSDERPTFIPLPDSDELLWFSERSGWAHLYLYSLETGELKNIVTQGNWVVRDIVHIDTASREVYLQTAGRSAGRDPYYRDLCRVHLDTGVMATLAEGDHEYWSVTQKNMNTFLANAFGRDVSAANSISPSGNFAVVTRSRADEAPASLIVNRDGKVVCEVEAADTTDLPNNWQWPEPVELLAADNVTNIYGLLFRPSDFSPERSYPIIAHLFANPEITWVSKGSFTNGAALGWPYLDAAALAELGFIVLQLDTRGTSCREKAFHDESYGWAESACNLDDWVAAIRQVAQRYSYIDLNRVGITSHTAGGPGGIQGLLQHPDFFSVGVNGLCHDSRLMSRSMWGDIYEGTRKAARQEQYPEELAGNLKGKLLMMHGMLDASCPPASMLRIVEALQQANKNFEMLLLPNVGHEMPGYMVRRAWDHFVRYLLEDEPPKEFKLTTGFDLLVQGLS